MADIVLTTLNAKYIHCAFGLRYVLANLGPLRPSACLAEFDIGGDGRVAQRQSQRSPAAEDFVGRNLLRFFLGQLSRPSDAV